MTFWKFVEGQCAFNRIKLILNKYSEVRLLISIHRKLTLKRTVVHFFCNILYFIPLLT
jgi:hypothetical protein